MKGVSYVIAVHGGAACADLFRTLGRGVVNRKIKTEGGPVMRQSPPIFVEFNPIGIKGPIKPKISETTEGSGDLWSY